MLIFSKKRSKGLFLFVLVLLLSACSKMKDGEPFSFFKTFINPDYVEAKFEDFDLDASNEKVDLESVPEGKLE